MTTFCISSKQILKAFKKSFDSSLFISLSDALSSNNFIDRLNEKLIMSKVLVPNQNEYHKALSFAREKKIITRKISKDSLIKLKGRSEKTLFAEEELIDYLKKDNLDFYLAFKEDYIEK